MAQAKEPLEETDESKDIENNDQKATIKLLFLEFAFNLIHSIDGVMNICGSDALFASDCVEVLKHIVDLTKCKIVLSSAWRRSPYAKERIKDHFTANGIKWSDLYLGDTPILDGCLVDINDTNCQRTYEIEAYLKSIQSEYVIQSWCAVDDMRLDSGDKSKEIIEGHFVQTNSYHGVTDKDAMQIISILNHK
eukprot:13761_1